MKRGEANVAHLDVVLGALRWAVVNVCQHCAGLTDYRARVERTGGAYVHTAAKQPTAKCPAGNVHARLAALERQRATVLHQ